jgi:hypothetical protein
MLKYWPLLAIVVILATVVGVSHYAESSNQRCEDTARKAKAAPVAESEDSKASSNTEDACKPPVWARYFTWPESVGAWAVILTLLVIAWQSIETAKAAQASLRQSDIQAAGMRQWVDIEALGCSSANYSLLRNGPDFAVDISFEAVNNTANVLTIRKIETIVEMVPDGSEVFIVETNVDLSPDKKSENNRYPFYIPAQSIKRELFNKGTVVTINGAITFDDCLGKRRSDYFGGLYECSEGKFVKLRALGVVPNRSVGKGLRLPHLEEKAYQPHGECPN